MQDSEIIKEQQLHTNLTCLDDDPSAARLAARQQFLVKWYRAVGLAPFFVAIVITMRFFADSDTRSFGGRIAWGLVFASLFWTIAIAAYTFYLQWFLKCPRCQWRFGL